MDIGKRLAYLRTKAELTQGELAEKAKEIDKTGITPKSISEIERNLVSPKIETLSLLCRSMEIDLHEFFMTRVPKPLRMGNHGRIHQLVEDLMSDPKTSDHLTFVVESMHGKLVP